MAWSQEQATFATFLIICPTCFFLGILFSLFPYDYPLLWTAELTPPEAFTRLESHLAFLYNSPPLIPRMFHIIIGTGLLGFFIKLYRPSDSNMLFDGASLALYTIAIIIYVTNIVKGMRVITDGLFDSNVIPGESEEGTPLDREDSLKVLSASNTILALVLVGVLVLQAGQWYAERKQRQEELALEKERADKAAERAAKGSSTRDHRSPAGSAKKKV